MHQMATCCNLRFSEFPLPLFTSVIEPRQEDGMTIALEEFTEWRDSVEGRLYRLEAVGDQHAEKFKYQEAALGAMDGDLSKIQVEFRAQRGMLQALHLTQNEHTARLTRLENGIIKVQAGIQTIIGLLDHNHNGGNTPDGN
jgi:hypothetical protein